MPRWNALSQRGLQVNVLLSVVLAASWGLHVEREPAALACPDEAGVRRAIAERLGSDPFVEPSTQQLVVSFSRDEAGHRALVLLINAAGKETGRRQLSARSSDCAELAGAVALAGAIVIDPLVLTRPAPDAGVQLAETAPPLVGPPPPPFEPPVEPPPKYRRTTNEGTVELPPDLGNQRTDGTPLTGSIPTVVPNRQPDSRPPPEPPKPSPPVNALWLGVGAGLSLAQVPAPAGVGEVLLSWESKDAQLSARFGLTTPGQLVRGSGTIEALLVDGGLNGCLRWSRFGVCLVTRVGTFQAWATGFPNPTGSQSALSVSAGLAPFLDIPAGDSLRFRLHATVFAQLARVSTTLGGVEAWASPPVGFSLTASALFRAWGVVQP